MSHLEVELVSTDERVWQGEASMVRARSVDGELGILPGHQPVLGVLVGGDVIVQTAAGTTETATVDSGFLSVEHDRVVIVADHVETSGFAD